MSRARAEAAARGRAEEAELNRRLDWLEQHTGCPADVEAVIVGMQRELHGPTVEELYAKHVLNRRAA